MRRRFLPVLVACCGVQACFVDLASPEICQTYANWGIVLGVRDARSLEPAGFGARLEIREGEYLEIVEGQLAGQPALSGATERAGRYELLVTKPGYQDWTAEGVVVGWERDSPWDDTCHVRTTRLEAVLVPL